MHKWPFSISLAIASLPLFSTAGRAETLRIGTHWFEVPQSHLVSADPRNQGFLVQLEPEAALPDRINVAVESRERVCARAAGTSAGINSTICARRPVRWRGEAIERSGGQQTWKYVLRSAAENDGAETSIDLVRCFGNENGGLCLAVLPERDLVLSLWINDAEVRNLEQLFDRAVALLRSWER